MCRMQRHWYALIDWLHFHRYELSGLAALVFCTGVAAAFGLLLMYPGDGGRVPAPANQPTVPTSTTTSTTRPGPPASTGGTGLTGPPSSTSPPRPPPTTQARRGAQTTSTPQATTALPTPPVVILSPPTPTTPPPRPPPRPPPTTPPPTTPPPTTPPPTTPPPTTPPTTHHHDTTDEHHRRRCHLRSSPFLRCPGDYSSLARGSRLRVERLAQSLPDDVRAALAPRRVGFRSAAVLARPPSGFTRPIAPCRRSSSRSSLCKCPCSFWALASIPRSCDE